MFQNCNKSKQKSRNKKLNYNKTIRTSLTWRFRSLFTASKIFDGKDLLSELAWNKLFTDKLLVCWADEYLFYNYGCLEANSFDCYNFMVKLLNDWYMVFNADKDIVEQKEIVMVLWFIDTAVDKR